MKLIYCSLLFLFVSCGHYVSVSKVAVDRQNLASSFARTPDPLQEAPPTGERLYVSWRLPLSLKPENHHLVLSVIYKDLTEECTTYPLHNRFGITEFSVVDDKFKKTKGLHAYQLLLLDENQNVVDKWEHQMWVKILHP